MALRYASLEDVLHHLEIADTDTAAIERVERIEHALADAFDHRIGRTYGAAAVAETREVVLTGTPARLVTSTGIHTLTGIDAGGTWDGTAWVDGEAVPATDYRLTMLDHSGLYWGIDHLTGSWSGTVRVTATWGDQSELAVPEDVSAALTFLTVRQYRRVTASPQELVGPDGYTVPTPHAWDDPTVKAAIDRHRAVRLVV
jgi:hypothetical protein